MRERKPDYLPFDQWTWKNYDGTEKININDFINKHNEEDRYFIIGTDSQNDKLCIFTTVLIAYKLGKGGTIIMHRDKVPYVQSLRQRLVMEAMRSLEVAWHIDPMIASKSTVEIHLDVNPNIKFNSGKYKEELVGMIVGNGFLCRIKPNAVGASKCADRKCK
jgi:predicted RNase H-related nuclease YkuK (DUF458 family)